MLAAERLEIVEKERPPITISRTPPLPTKYIRCSIGTADIFLYGSKSNVGVRIIKFHNTIFSDIKICLLAEA